jgi:hypothetical protein
MIDEETNREDWTPKNNRWLNWLSKMYDKGCITEAMYHQMFGRFCGYLDCCVDLFCLYASFNHDLQIYGYMEYLFGRDYPRVGYVRCPKCRRKNNEETLQYEELYLS